MADLEFLKANRRKKLKELRRRGINAYPEHIASHKSIGEVRASFAPLLKKQVTLGVAGRVIGLRGHGGALFIDITDESGTMQTFLSRDVLGEKIFSIAQNIDLGDFIVSSGKLFRTKRGENTLAVKHLSILSKAIRPLPSQWYGLRDVEERFRYREIDLLLNAKVKKRFHKRSRLLRALREELEKKGFLEVETPILQPVPGGASAEPFKTVLRALRLPLYLRVAPELYLKRLLVGGFEKVYEMGRSFRNEGMDQTHNPEFTMLEFYWAYQDLEGLAAFSENMLRHSVKASTGSAAISFRGMKIDFAKRFTRFEYVNLFKKYTGLDVLDVTKSNLSRVAEKLGVKVDGALPESTMIDHLFKKAVQPHLDQPTFVFSHPLSLSPLAKNHEENLKWASRFQIFAGGLELANAYAELNDPDEQRRRFQQERKKRRQGDREAQRSDEDFLVALEYGMPPAAGFGLGIDRFAMLVADAPSLREIIFFPTMRPKKKGQP